VPEDPSKTAYGGLHYVRRNTPGEAPSSRTELVLDPGSVYWRVGQHVVIRPSTISGSTHATMRTLLVYRIQKALNLYEFVWLERRVREGDKYIDDHIVPGWPNGDDEVTVIDLRDS